MKQIISACVSKMLPATLNEKFQDGGAVPSNGNLVVLLVTAVVIQILLMVLGKYLWNNFLVKAVTIFKPVDSIWTILAISILARLLLCCQ